MPEVLDLAAKDVFLFDYLDEGREVIQVHFDIDDGHVQNVRLTFAQVSLAPDEVSKDRMRPEYANREEREYRPDDIVRVARR